MPEPLRVALLGCGTFAEMLADLVYPQVRDEVNVIAAIDVRPERAIELANRLDARAYSSVDAACSELPVEGIDIRLPHHMHLLGATAAADVGCHMLVEKPMASNVRDAQRILGLACRSGLILGVSENYDFVQPVVKARDLLRDGAIGELLTVSTRRVYELGPNWRRDGWRLQQGEAGGVVVDQATHVSRMLRLVVGEIVEVSAYGTSRRTGWVTEDSATVNCRFASGVIGQQLYCWACPTPEPGPELVLYGSLGSVEVHISYTEPGGGTVLRKPDRGEEWFATGNSYSDSLAGVLVDWSIACRNGRSPIASGEAGLRDVAVMAAIRESIRIRRPVEVQEVARGTSGKRDEGE